MARGAIEKCERSFGDYPTYHTILKHYQIDDHRKASTLRIA